MASQNKKRKAKNSYLSNGGEKLDGKNKRIMYYTKRQRKKIKGAGQMNKQKIIILAVTVLLLLTGCKDNNQEYCDMPNNLMTPMLKEWVSPDGVHYWLYSDDYCSGLTPRYDNKGDLVIESNY